MFAPKTQNKNQSPNPNSGLGSNFIQPKMEVVKSDEKKEDKGVSKEQPKKEADKTTFFAPQKVTAKKEENKEKGDTKEEGKEEASSLGEKQTASTSQILTTITETNAKQEVKPDKQPTVKAKKGEASKEQTGKKEKEGKEKKEEVGKEEQSIPKAPTRPEDDPAFQQQIKQTEQTRDEKSQHPQAETKVAEQKEAGHASAEAQSKKNDQQAHSEAMNATSEAEKKREPFTPESFKKMLEKNLSDLEKELPKNSDEAKEFREEKPINKIKNNISSQVTAESNKLAGPMKNEADKPAPASGQPIQEAKQLPAAAPGAKPKPLNAKAAVPKPKTSQEISMEKESQSLDDYMAENKVTDEQLAKSNEPKFTGALEEKNNAQTEATLAPVKYRKKEQAQLAVAKKVADGTGKAGMEQMQAAKVLSENTVLTNQTTNKTNDKTEQEKIYAEFEKIYESTKKTVTDSLEQLSENVDKKFSQEAEAAQKTFEKNVEDGLGEIYGWTVVDDWIFGEDTEAIDKLFRKEKSKFITTMNKVLDDISVIIANGLNGALDAIAEGKKKSKEKFDSLDASQKKLAEDAFNDFNGQYTDLEDTVYEKQEELAADLARSYKENVDSLQGKFDEIKEKVSAGWIGAAFNALAGVIKTILKIKDMLLNLLSAAVSAIGAIISDPIGFLSNLIQGVKQGFVDFGTNIKQHIIKGLIEWLTGSLGNVGITMPDNLFSLSGIFSLITQMLGLTWDYFRGKAVKHLGEPMVGAMEKGVEIFQIVRKDGVKGLWEYIKEQFTNLKEMVMDAIRDMIITKVIEAGIKWIMGLLSPAGAFVKAAMMIIDIVKFFVERAAQIFELVNAFINSIKALAAGNVKAVAKAIETALAKAIPVLISFLAALVGVTGLTGKIQKIIKKVRKKIDKAIDKIIFKAKKTFKNLVKKGKAKVKGALKKIWKWWKKYKEFKLKDRSDHKLFFKKKNGQYKLYMASENEVDVEESPNENFRKLRGHIKNVINTNIRILKDDTKTDEQKKIAQEKLAEGLNTLSQALSKFSESELIETSPGLKPIERIKYFKDHSDWKVQSLDGDGSKENEDNNPVFSRDQEGKKTYKRSSIKTFGFEDYYNFISKKFKGITRASMSNWTANNKKDKMDLWAGRESKTAYAAMVGSAYTFIESDYQDKIFFIGGNEVDEDLVKAVSDNGGLTGFLIKLSEGNVVIGDGTYTLTTFKNKFYNLSTEQGKSNKKWLSSQLRKPKKHEWLPTSEMMDIVQKAIDKGDVGMAAEGVKFIQYQDKVRSDTWRIVFYPAKSQPDDKDGYKMLSGHSGAIYLNGKHRTKAQADFHDELRDELASAETADGLKSNIWNNVADQWILDSNAVSQQYYNDLHPDLVHTGHGKIKNKPKSDYDKFIDDNKRQIENDLK